MRKTAAIVSSVLVLMLLLAYVASSAIVTSRFRRYLPRIAQQIEEKTAFKVDDLDLESCSLLLPRGVVCHKVEGTMQVSSHPFIKEGTKFDFLIDAITLQSSNYSFTKLVLSGEGFSVEAKGDVKPVDYGEIVPESISLQDGELSITNFRYEVDLPKSILFSSNSPELKEFLKGEFARLNLILSKGHVPDDFLFEGLIHVALKSKSYRLRLVWKGQGGNKSLVLLEKDLHQLTGDFKSWLTREEIRVIAANPLKAPRLLQIKYYAEKKAEEKFPDLDDPKRAAFRHILWSYLLAREFGAELSETITSAHEKGVPYKSENARRMDASNSKIGRDYLRRNVLETEILSVISEDPDVVHLDRTL